MIKKLLFFGSVIMIGLLGWSLTVKAYIDDVDEGVDELSENWYLRFEFVGEEDSYYEFGQYAILYFPEISFTIPEDYSMEYCTMIYQHEQYSIQKQEQIYDDTYYFDFTLNEGNIEIVLTFDSQKKLFNMIIYDVDLSLPQHTYYITFVFDKIEKPSFIGAIFDNISNAILGMIVALGALFSGVALVFFDDGLTFIGILTLFAFGVFLARWGFKLVLRLLKLGVKK